MARPDSRSRDLEIRASWVGPSPAGRPDPTLLGGVSRKHPQQWGTRSRKKEELPLRPTSFPSLLCWYRVPLDSQAKLERLAHPAPKLRR